MDKMKMAICQMDSKNNKKDNIESAVSLLEQAGKKGADMAALPEMFTFIGDSERYRSAAEEIPGPATRALADKAREHDMWVHGGSMFEVAEEDGKVHNTTVVFDREGDRKAIYRKIHLFDVTIGDEVIAQESERVVPGDRIVSLDTEFGTMGLTICYDLRFPELFSKLAERGSNIIFLPAAFTKHTGKDHWETMLRTRAIETQSYLVAPGQIGDKPHSVPKYGRSLIADPWGNVVTKASDTEGVVTANLDFDYLNTIQQELPSLKHKRKDIYS